MPVHVQVIIVGGGIAGLSAAIYLGRARRDALVIDGGKSMARWEPRVENYLGFPFGISGRNLLQRASRQARQFGTKFQTDEISSARLRGTVFQLEGQTESYTCDKLLLATGVFHIPPDLPCLESCLGQSLFFCKDCDGIRVKGKRVAVYGWTNDTADYALGMRVYADSVCVLTDGRKPAWDEAHARVLELEQIPVYAEPIERVETAGSRLRGFILRGGREEKVDALFTTRGDIVLNALGKQLGAELDAAGQIQTDIDMRTSVKGLYAAGCVTPANCQMIIAAGQGATAAQTINYDLFQELFAERAATARDGSPAKPQETLAALTS